MVSGCVSAILDHATFDHVYLDDRVIHLCQCFFIVRVLIGHESHSPLQTKVLLRAESSVPDVAVAGEENRSNGAGGCDCGRGR